ncbi:MAG: hypothetical protein ACLRWM_03350, partial [Streptococcus sp.]
DLGHAPYGHVGEKALDKILQIKGFGYFAHNANSVRNILFIERDGIGYNVSLQVLDAILCHNGEMLSKKYMPDYDKTIAQFCQEYEDCWHQKNTSNYSSNDIRRPRCSGVRCYLILVKILKTQLSRNH